MKFQNEIFAKMITVITILPQFTVLALWKNVFQGIATKRNNQ